MHKVGSTATFPVPCKTLIDRQLRSLLITVIWHPYGHQHLLGWIDALLYRMYQVMFRNNKAVGAKKVERASFFDVKDFERKDKRLFIKWFLVDSDDKKTAMEIAEKVVKVIWGNVLDYEY